MASKLAAAILGKTSMPEVGDTGAADPGLEAACEEMMNAPDAAAFARAFRNAFQMCEAMPHDEGGEE